MLTEYGKFLKKLRVDVGETRAEMAEKLGISAVYLSFIENGSRGIPLTFSADVWEKYHLTPEQTKEMMAAERATPSRRFTIELDDFQDGWEHIHATRVFAAMITKLSKEQAQELGYELEHFAVKNGIPRIVGDFS